MDVGKLEAALLEQLRKSEVELYNLLSQSDLVNFDWPPLKEARERIDFNIKTLIGFRIRVCEAKRALEALGIPPEKGSGGPLKS